MVVTNTIPLSEEFKAKTNKVTSLSIAWMLSTIIEAISNHDSVSAVYSAFEDRKSDER